MDLPKEGTRSASTLPQGRDGANKYARDNLSPAPSSADQRNADDAIQEPSAEDHVDPRLLDALKKYCAKDHVDQRHADALKKFYEAPAEDHVDPRLVDAFKKYWEDPAEDRVDQRHADALKRFCEDPAEGNVDRRLLSDALEKFVEEHARITDRDYHVMLVGLEKLESGDGTEEEKASLVKLFTEDIREPGNRAETVDEVLQRMLERKSTDELSSEEAKAERMQMRDIARGILDQRARKRIEEQEKSTSA